MHQSVVNTIGFLSLSPSHSFSESRGLILSPSIPHSLFLSPFSSLPSLSPLILSLLLPSLSLLTSFSLLSPPVSLSPNPHSLFSSPLPLSPLAHSHLFPLSLSLYTKKSNCLSKCIRNTKHYGRSILELEKQKKPTNRNVSTDKRYNSRPVTTFSTSAWRK